MKKVLSYILLLPIYFYRACISPMTPASCRFMPTCSQYAIEAIKKHGPFKGLFLAIRRILRCHPWGGSGFDLFLSSVSMNILDIHTHRLKENISTYIYSCMPTAFSPQEGGYYSVGIHPWNINSTTESEYEYLKKIVSNPQIIAIGEAGLDKMIPIELSYQQEIFKWHIELSETLRKPLIIHSVKTANEIIQLKKKFCPESPWIIHGFRGKKELAEQLTGQGIYLSFGEKYQKDAINCIPLNRLLLETDESDKDILLIYETVAKSHSLSTKQLVAQVQQNISKLFFNR